MTRASQASAKAQSTTSSSSCEGMKILVINAGSSSFKYLVLNMNTEQRLCQGLVERIGAKDGMLTHRLFPGTPQEAVTVRKGAYATHADGIREMAAMLQAPEGGIIGSPKDIAAVGHRVLLAGSEHAETLVDESVKQTIRDYIPLGPLHNTANLAGIETIEELFPDAPNVAVFDTGFHVTIPDHAHTYAIPRELAQKHRIRRYGFHGTSHRYVAGEAAKLIGRSLTRLNIITCHLGNGCSICAVERGRSVDTSMGLTPLEGLIMGTRSGSIDPAIPTYLMQTESMTPDAMNALLNQQSGLKGLCGHSDMRDLLAAREAGDKHADLAFRMFVYAIRKCIGSYYAVLGHVDALVFTGGIGENAAEVRAEVCKGMTAFGLSVLDNLNTTPIPTAHAISPTSARTAVLVIPTDEELEIARATVRVVASCLT